MEGGELDIDSFAFRYACYKEFGWTPDEVDALNEIEAVRIAITLSEEARYQRKQLKDTKPGTKRAGGLQDGFEEDFSFGEAEDEEDQEITDIDELRRIQEAARYTALAKE